MIGWVSSSSQTTECPLYWARPVVQKTLVDNHPEWVKGIVNATMTGIKFCVLNSALCVADFIKVNPTFKFSDALASVQLMWTNSYGPPFNDPAKVNSQLSTPTSMERTIAKSRALVQPGAGKCSAFQATLDPNTLYTNQFAQHP